MRYLPALAVATVALIAVTGCEERRNMRELPDRQGHAYQTDDTLRDQTGGIYLADNEQTYVIVKGDTLKSLTKKFGQDEGWYIRRNDLQSNVLTPGQTVVVPKAAAPAAPAK